MNIHGTVKILFLFFGLIYSFIPFEASSSDIALIIRLIAISILTIYIYTIGGLKKNVYASIIFFFLIIFSLLSAFISISLYLFVFLAAITSGYIIANAIQYSPYLNKLFISAWKWLLIFSIGMLFLQIVIFFLTGDVLKLHEIVFPWSEARFEIHDMIGLVRFGGIYIEPGTYSNLMYIFLIIYMMISRSSNNLLLYIGALSIIVTMSVWGMIAGSYLLILLTIVKIKKFTLKKLLFVVPILIVISIYGFNYIFESPALKFAQDKLEMKSDSGHAKVLMVNRFQENILDYLIVGDGFKSQLGIGILSSQDVGVLLNLSIVFGIFFTMLILIIYMFGLSKQGGVILLLASLPILTSKIFYWDFSFWLFFFITVYGSASIHKKSKYKYLSLTRN